MLKINFDYQWFPVTSELGVERLSARGNGSRHVRSFVHSHELSKPGNSCGPSTKMRRASALEAHPKRTVRSCQSQNGRQGGWCRLRSLGDDVVQAPDQRVRTAEALLSGPLTNLTAGAEPRANCAGTGLYCKTAGKPASSRAKWPGQIPSGPHSTP